MFYLVYRACSLGLFWRRPVVPKVWWSASEPRLSSGKSSLWETSGRTASDTTVTWVKLLSIHQHSFNFCDLILHSANILLIDLRANIIGINIFPYWNLLFTSYLTLFFILVSFLVVQLWIKLLLLPCPFRRSFFVVSSFKLELLELLSIEHSNFFPNLLKAKDSEQYSLFHNRTAMGI